MGSGAGDDDAARALAWPTPGKAAVSPIAVDKRKRSRLFIMHPSLEKRTGWWRDDEFPTVPAPARGA
jgi:hypothetical protein